MLILFYVAGLLLPIVLPALAVGHALMFTLFNSQGYTHHGYQIVTLTLVAQAATVLYYTALKGLRLQPPDALLNSWLLVQSQAVVAGTYLVSFFTKILATGGMWLWNANYIAIDLIKTQRQHYFSRFDPSDAGNPAEAMWLLEHPWIARGFFASGALLEAIAFLALANRRLGFPIGAGLDSHAPQRHNPDGAKVSIQRDALCHFPRRDSVFRGAMPGARALPRRTAWYPDWRGIGCSLELLCAAGFGADVNASSRLPHQLD